MNTQIEVVLTLASPLYVAYPENQDKLPGGKVISRTAKVGYYNTERLTYVPIYMANGFRGGLRRKAAARLMDHFKANEGTVSGDFYIGLTCGASSGSPDKSALSIEEIVRARSNVYMGLFGGGARLHQSMYRVSDMVPVIEATLRAHAVPQRYAELMCRKGSRTQGGAAEPVQPWELLSTRTPIRVDDLSRVSRPDEVLSYITDPIASVTAHHAALAQNKSDLAQAEEEGVKETRASVANMMSLETVNPGVPCYFRIDLDNDVSHAQLGLLLLCLQDLFTENAFGGWTRCGFGKVRVDQIRLQHEDRVTVWDQLYDDEGCFHLPEAAAPFVTAAGEGIASLKIADMTTFFEDFSAGTKEKEKTKAREKKAAKAAAAAEAKA